MTSPHTEQESDLSLPDLPPGLIALKTFIFLYTTHIYLSNELKLLFFFLFASVPSCVHYYESLVSHRWQRRGQMGQRRAPIIWDNPHVWSSIQDEVHVDRYGELW